MWQMDLTKQSQVEPDLSWVLSDPGTSSQVGPEEGEPQKYGISVFKDPNGSYRYVYYSGGRAIAGLQVVANEQQAIVANVFTDPEYRRRGHASELFRVAKRDFPNLQHSQDTDAAQPWIDGMEANKNYLDDDVVEEYLDADDLQGLLPILDANDVTYYDVDFPTGKKVTILDMPEGMWVVEIGEDGVHYNKDAHEWVRDTADRFYHEFYPETDPSAEFWEGVNPGAYLYHATQEENLESIMQNGLEARCDTRGLSNRNMGCGVFTVSDPGNATLDSYGGVIIQIDVGDMKQDGYMPEVSGETPIEEAEMQNSIAHHIGLEDFDANGDVESGLDPDTLAIFSDVPVKYLTVYDGDRYASSWSYKYAESVNRNKDLLAKIRKEYLFDAMQLSKLFATPESFQEHKELGGRLHDKYNNLFYHLLLSENMAQLSRGSKDISQSAESLRSKAWDFILAFNDTYDMENNRGDFEKLKTTYFRRIRRTGREAINAAQDYVSYTLETGTETSNKKPLDPTIDYGQKVTVGNFTLMPDSGATEEAMQRSVETLKQAIHLIEQTPMKDVLGKMLVYVDNLSKELISAEYSMEDDTMRLRPLGQLRPETIVHELGHRHYYQLLPYNARRWWEQQFEGNVYEISTEFINEWVNTIGELLNSDLMINQVYEQATQTMKQKYPDQAQQVDRLLDFSPYWLKDPQNPSDPNSPNKLEQFREWIIESYGPGNQHMSNHVSDYANTNPTEAYAETFMNIVLDKKVDPTIEDWFNRLIHVRAKSQWNYKYAMPAGDDMRLPYSNNSHWRNCPACGEGQFFDPERYEQCPGCGRSTDDLTGMDGVCPDCKTRVTTGNIANCQNCGYDWTVQAVTLDSPMKVLGPRVIETMGQIAYDHTKKMYDQITIRDLMSMDYDWIKDRLLWWERNSKSGFGHNEHSWNKKTPEEQEALINRNSMSDLRNLVVTLQNAIQSKHSEFPPEFLQWAEFIKGSYDKDTQVLTHKENEDHSRKEYYEKQKKDAQDKDQKARLLADELFRNKHIWDDMAQDGEMTPEEALNIANDFIGASPHDRGQWRPEIREIAKKLFSREFPEKQHFMEPNEAYEFITEAQRKLGQWYADRWDLADDEFLIDVISKTVGITNSTSIDPMDQGEEDTIHPGYTSTYVLNPAKMMRSQAMSELANRISAKKDDQEYLKSIYQELDEDLRAIFFRSKLGSSESSWNYKYAATFEDGGYGGPSFDLEYFREQYQQGSYFDQKHLYEDADYALEMSGVSEKLLWFEESVDPQVFSSGMTVESCWTDDLQMGVDNFQLLVDWLEETEGFEFDKAELDTYDRTQMKSIYKLMMDWDFDTVGDNWDEWGPFEWWADGGEWARCRSINKDQERYPVTVLYNGKMIDGAHRLAVASHNKQRSYPAWVGVPENMLQSNTASAAWKYNYSAGLSVKYASDDLFDKTKNDMFETGRPAEFNYLRNTETSPDMGEKFQQHIEPAGRYLIHDEIADGKHPDLWESGMAMFDNPLVIKFHSTPGEVSYNEGSWKMRLSRAYNGLGGIELSRAIIADGHDGIVTIKIDEAGNQETSEIVDLRPIKEASVKQAQISATDLPENLWYHGTDSRTAYSLMSKMILEPRSETGESSYVGSISSIPSAVYLTLSPGKAAKHAIERAEQQKTQPVILVIQPEDLGNVHVDEDMIQMLLNGRFDGKWYPSPMLEKEIFDQAAAYLQVEDFDSDKSNKALVLEHLQYYREHGGNEEIEDEFFEEEGIIPTEKGDLEYDPSMHAAKDIAKSLNDKHQREAIVNFQSMAHDGSVRASEIYLIPWNIDRPTDEGGSWKDSPTSMRTYEELVQFGEQIDPQQLMMSFMSASSKWQHKYGQLDSEQILQSMIPQFITVAQAVYNEWDASDPVEGDWQVGFGGICHLIAEKIADVINQSGFEATTLSAQMGEQHVWVIVKTPDGIYEVDIPPCIYEVGSGYKWKKLPDIEFGQCDIVINMIDGDPNNWNNFTEGSGNWNYKYAGLWEDVEGLSDKSDSTNIYDWKRRDQFTKEFGWSIPTKKSIEIIRQFVGDNQVLEVGAGKGTWAKLMQDMGIQVTPTDLHAGTPYGEDTDSPSLVHDENPHWKKENLEEQGIDVDRQTFTPVYQMSAEDAVAQFGGHSVLFLNWPPYDSPMAANALKSFQGDKVIYVGEGGGGCTGDDCFHEILANNWEQNEYVCIPQWFGIHDCLTLYTRKVSADPNNITSSYWKGEYAAGLSIKIADQLPMDQVLDHLTQAITNYIDGDWEVMSSRKLMPSFRLQKYGVLELMGRNVKTDGDIYYVKVFYLVRKQQGDIEYPPGYFADDNPPGGKWIGPANSQERTDTEKLWKHPYDKADSYDHEIGHQLLYFRGFVEGWKGPNAMQHDAEDRLFPISDDDPRSMMIRIGTFGSDSDDRTMEEQNPADTPYSVAKIVRNSIDGFWDSSGGENQDTPIEPTTPTENVPTDEPINVVAQVQENTMSDWSWDDRMQSEWMSVLDIIDDDNDDDHLGDENWQYDFVTAAYRRKPYAGPPRYFGPARLIRFLGTPAIIGNTMKIRRDLPNLGFRWDGKIQIDATQLGDAVDNVVNGAMVGSRELTPEEINGLMSMGVDMSMQMTEFQPFFAQPPVQPEVPLDPNAEPVVQAQPQQGAQDQMANIKMIKQLRDAASNSEKGQVVEDQVKKLIGLMTDPNLTEEQAALKTKFLEFMASAHNYSFFNMILVFMQNSSATMVGGAKNFWGSKGRSLSEGAQPIWILAPRIASKRVSKPEYARMADALRKKGTPENEIKDIIKKQLGRQGQLLGFKDVPVYDASQTQPIPGWTDANGNPSFDVDSFHKSYRNKMNTPDEYADALFFATKGAAEKMSINVSSKATGNAGGYSSGGNIVLDDSSMGERRVATMFHEFAHEVLHQGEENKKKRAEEKTEKKHVELEAEATAFLLTQAFEIQGDPQWAARYIFLWDNKPEDVMARQSNIHRAYKQIFEIVTRELDDIISKSQKQSWNYSYTKTSWNHEFKEATVMPIYESPKVILNGLNYMLPQFNWKLGNFGQEANNDFPAGAFTYRIYADHPTDKYAVDVRIITRNIEAKFETTQRSEDVSFAARLTDNDEMLSGWTEFPHPQSIIMAIKKFFDDDGNDEAEIEPEPEPNPQVSTPTGSPQLVPASSIWHFKFGHQIVPIGEYGGEDHEFDNDQLAGQAYELAGQSTINILSDKEPNLVAVENGRVIGALFTSLVAESYSFDVVVAPEFQRKGIGRELIDAGMMEFQNLKNDMPEIEMDLDVTNPILQDVLRRRGLGIKQRIGDDRAIMGKSVLTTITSSPGNPVLSQKIDAASMNESEYLWHGGRKEIATTGISLDPQGNDGVAHRGFMFFTPSREVAEKWSNASGKQLYAIPRNTIKGMIPEPKLYAGDLELELSIEQLTDAQFIPVNSRPSTTTQSPKQDYQYVPDPAYEAWKNSDPSGAS